MSQSGFLSYKVGAWDDESLILQLSAFPGAPLFPVDLKQWSVYPTR